MNRRRLLSACLLIAAATAGARAQQPTIPLSNPADLTALPLEDLMKIEVTSTFKTPMPLMQVPAAFFVLTQDDIRRSGARSIPEALRQVPGVEVARLGNAYYIVTVRGFGANPSNKLLVMVDGRSIYTPYQDGVYWEIEDVLLADVDRIEVIRGPGGSLWGANAVNGIINIVTKHSRDTHGGLVMQSVGNQERNRSDFRYGGALGKSGDFRLFGSYGVRRATETMDGTSAHDGADLSVGGFRADLDLGKKNSLLLEGSVGRYFISENQDIFSAKPPYDGTSLVTDSITTSHVLGRWEHDASNGAHSSAQLYYDLVDYPYTNQSSEGTTYDLDVEHRFASMGKHSIAVGTGYRYMVNDTAPGPSSMILPRLRRDSVFSAFGQDDILMSKTTHLTLGLKVEHNDYTGFEVQPNLRFSYTPDSDHTVWAAVGRAVRTPSQSESNMFSLTSVTAPDEGQSNPVATANIGNPHLSAERLIANEIGYRAQVNSRVSVDIATFYNFYDNLIYTAPGSLFTSNVFEAPLTIDPSYYLNGDRGQTYGVEVSSKVKLSPNLRSDLGFTMLRNGHFDHGTPIESPHFQATAHLAWNPNSKLEVDGLLHWYDANFDMGVPAYTRLDLRLGWTATDRLSLSVTGFDLLTPRRVEFGSGLNSSSGAFDNSDWIPRSFTVQATYRF